MLRTNVVLETQPGAARCVADIIGGLKDMELLRVESDHRVVVVWSLPDGEYPEPEGVSEVLRAMSGEILEVTIFEV
jgi:hypothetical protein